VSNKTEAVDQNGIQDIFATTQRNNHIRNITGILLFLENSFLQVLEGERNEVASLFTKIQNDNRHENIFVVIDKSIEKCTFKNYKSGFSFVKDAEDLNNLKNYLNTSSDSIKETENILNILQPFLL
jgi:hypothetical protein